jgi:hypothetical protein
MIAAASFGLRRSGTFCDGNIGSGLLGRISEAWPALAPPGECSYACDVLALNHFSFAEALADGSDESGTSLRRAVRQVALSAISKPSLSA